MKEIYFENVINIGNLYLNKILNRFEDENIIFVCTDDNNDYYFSVCYEIRNALKWIICKTDSKTIALALMKKIDLYSVFQRSKEDFIQIIFDGNNETSNFISLKNIDRKYLPTPGIFFKEETDLYQYVYKLLLEYNVSYNSTFNYTYSFSEIDLNDFCTEDVSVSIPDESILVAKYDYSKNKNAKNEMTNISLCAA